MEKVSSSRTVFTTPKFSVEEAIVELPGGKTEPRWYVIKQDFVGIIPIDTSGNILLIREYRSAYEGFAWGIPGGGREEGETPESTAHRELREETGYDGRDLYLFEESDSIFATIKEKQFVFVAKELYRSPLKKDEWEDIKIHPTSQKKVLNLILEGQLPNKMALALLRYLYQSGNQLEGILNSV